MFRSVLRSGVIFPARSANSAIHALRCSTRGETLLHSQPLLLRQASTLRDSRASDASAEGVVSSGFAPLGLRPVLLEALQGMGLSQPTGVQSAVIPALLARENLVIAASTGSGKTLAFCLPVLDHLLAQEQEKGEHFVRLPQRPRVLVLVPTRDLAKQVLGAIKSLSHVAKVSSCAVVGGEPYAVQTKSLSRVVDVVVGSPGRLLQHRKQGNVFFSQLTHVVIDEVDTMLMQGFGPDIRSILQGAMTSNRKQSARAKGGQGETAGEMGETAGDKESAKVQVEKPPVQLIVATATLTPAVRALLGSVEGGKGFDVNMPSLQPKDKDNKDKGKSAAGQEQGQAQAQAGPARIVGLYRATPAALAASASAAADAAGSRVPMRQVEVAGLHRALAHVKHAFIQVKGDENKLDALQALLSRRKAKGTASASASAAGAPAVSRTLVFCNRVSSAQAVQHYLVERGELGNVPAYHGDLNSSEREENLQRFRAGLEQLLVCTDLAARGLDIPEIDHVVMFDFPLNAIDYLHRSGRAGRAGRAGLVTSFMQKRDYVLGSAIQSAVEKGLPIDSLTSSKRDYRPGGKLASSASSASSPSSSSSSWSKSKGQGMGAANRAARGVKVAAGLAGRRSVGQGQGREQRVAGGPKQTAVRRNGGGSGGGGARARPGGGGGSGRGR